MAIDVHVSFEESHHHETEFSVDAEDPLVGLDLAGSVLADSENAPCSDAGGHCSHHQAHSSGLVLFTTFQALNSRPVLNSFLKSTAITRKITPPFRPPIS